MADNVPITAGTGTSIRTEDRSGIQTQVVVLDVGGTTGERMAGSTQKDSGDWAVWVEPRAAVTRIQVTPTVSSSPAYSVKDCMGSYMSFTNAVRSSGGSGRVVRAQVADLSATRPDLDLLLFNQSISGTTTATDNANFDLADGDVGKLIGAIPIGGGFYADFNDNSVADVPCDLPFVLSGTTTLTGLLIVRSAVTLASTGDIVVSLTIAQD